MTPPRLQNTIGSAASASGRGYWSGAECRVEFRPAPPNHGVVFVRDDLPGAPRIAVRPESRRPMARRTVLAERGPEGGAEVAMVEHVLAALSGQQIDNCEVGVTAAEMPGCDGSAAPFVLALAAAGLQVQAAVADTLVVRRPIRCGDDHVWIEARPPIGSGLSIEYRLDYGAGSAIARQWRVEEITPQAFQSEIAPARTFLLSEEADAMVEQGVGAHVTPQDLLIFGAEGPIENTLRYEDECVRHKILDVVGDLALAGRPIAGHIVACCSGHRLNGDLVETLLASHQDTQSDRMSA
ncbi:UDP-3-O-[3-hydroxymyristoyl] N-acetylglucosamine deacetylase [Pseudobythopirellula maris]|uniref:UDP-3-O-acyl-N-acetylglucosamine deacetylase n=1 Tax=Pseudobythopirellula maris TaxID=2527991 RepID=A0A5C5ZUR9_9BACT|nr:UDP-3-O-acyl-N-acetylglucosamine deacetylase [Pseudobythopirellula maris]TWT90631.1 UDP-3-O-[3-hydroxymyristoyl] N-acetylglucosamine deacetylase [Pseudobythopirellula maris]